MNTENTGNKSILERFSHVIAVVVLLAIACIFCYPALQGKMISAHDTSQHKGMSKEIVEHREQFGEEPLWTNGMFSGMPTYQISMLYPKNLINYVDKALNFGLPHPVNYLFKYMLGFYLLLIVLRVPWKQAIPGAIAFAFSTYFIIIIEAGHNSKANTLAYIAPIFASLILTFRGKYLLGGALAAFFLALNMVANHPQVTYYTGLSIGLFVLAELVHKLKQGQLKQFGLAAIASIIAFGLGVMVNNTNLRLTSDYSKDSQRGVSRLEIKKRVAEEQQKALREKYEKEKKEKEKKGEEFVEPLSPKKDYATMWSYGVQEAFTLLIPNFSGGGSADPQKDTKTYKAWERNLKQYNLPKKQRAEIAGKRTGGSLYWGEQPGVNGPVYLGAGIVLLFIIGLVLVESHYKWWLLGTAVLGLFISFGKNFLFFFDFMFDYFPLYDKLRAVTIGMIITEFAVPVLGFMLIRDLVKGKIPKEKAYKVTLYATGGLALLLLVFAMFGESLFAFTSAKEQGMDAASLKMLKGDRVSIFKSDVMRSLLFVLLTGAGVLALIKNWVKPQLVAIGLGVVFLFDLAGVSGRYLNKSVYKSKKAVLKPFKKEPVNDAILKDQSTYRVFNLKGDVKGALNDASTSYFHKTIGGYSSVKLMIYQDLLDYSLRGDMSFLKENIDKVKQQFGGVPPQVFDQITDRTHLINMLNTKYVIVGATEAPLVNNNAYGNAWLVEGVKTYTSPDSVMFNLSTHDLKKQALAEEQDVKDVAGKSYSIAGSIKLTDYKSNHLTYEFDGPEDAFAVFSEIEYKGWNAYIDDQLVPHNKVNYVLRGLEIPKGKHKVEFYFEPEIYAQGESISLLGSLLIFGLLGFSGFRYYKSKKA